MRTKKPYFIFGFVFFIWLFIGCSGTKYLAEDEKFYDGARLKLRPEKNIVRKKSLKVELNDFLKPEPNTVVLGSRPSVWFYHLAGEPKKNKGFKHWMKTKLGNPPVVFDDTNPVQITRTLETALHNRGYFKSKLEYKVISSKNKASLVYKAEVERPFRYRKLQFSEGESVISRAIRGTKAKTLIDSGAVYDLSTLQKERARIDKSLKNIGFFHFDEEYIVFKADSTVGNYNVDVFLETKPNMPKKADNQFQIGDIYVFPGDPGGKKDLRLDTTQVENMSFIATNYDLRFDILADAIQFGESFLYRVQDRDFTIDRLMDLGVFRFVNINYQERKDNWLDAYIRMFPLKKKTLRLEMQMVSTSNNFVGPGFDASFIDRNLLRGAEKFQLTLTSGFETQISGRQSSSLNSLELGLEASLLIPRFLVPFDFHTTARFLPKTKFKTGFRILERINQFRLNSFEAGYSYIWKQSATKTHELAPVDINFVELGNTSEEFDSLIMQNQFLARSYQEQFILGSDYSFTYNSQSLVNSDQRIHNFFINGTLGLSGNLMYLLQKTARSESRNGEGSFSIFGSTFSQYVRSSFDFRHYYRISSKSKLASRFLAGVGYPFGNSESLPFIKQFSIGGSTSIRAFRARSLGPGSVETSRLRVEDQIVLDQTADIKLEANTEYRFEIIGAFKGAVFVDAGNIWDIRLRDFRPKGKFEASDFLSEIGIGTGFGLRYDIQFFVLRLDLAFPLRIPSLEKGNRWVVDEIDPLDSDWRSENLILNLAIGYPF